MPTLNLGRVGFVNKGTWLIATAYKINDIVTYLGGTYACLIANTGQTPILGGTIYWQEWVSEDTVHKSGTETITGQKTFSLSPIVPTPANGDSTTKTASTAFVAAAIPYNINASTAKTTPIDADKFGIWDSVSGLLNSVSWANIKATLKTYFDTLYPAISNNPSFLATGASQAFTASVITKLACGTEQLDNTSAYDSVTNYRFTPQKAGWYHVGVQMQSALGNYGASISIYKNGTNYQRLQSTLANTIIDTLSGSCMVYLNGTTDYIEAYGSWSSNNNAISVFNAHFIVGV